MNYKNIQVEQAGRTAQITINRPPMNVIDIPTMAELNDAIGRLDKDPIVTVIVFRGSGDKAFSSGVDIRDHTKDKVDTMLRSFHDIFRKLFASDKITLASVHGYCLGGGMELASVCDFVIATETAVFGQPEIKVGCYPPVAAAWLPALIGTRKANEITLLGETFSAKAAYEMGLVNSVVPNDQLTAETQRWIERILQSSSSVLKLSKQALRAGNTIPFLQALDEAERIYLETLVKTEDIEEGINAYTGKRKPVWTHR